MSVPADADSEDIISNDADYVPDSESSRDGENSFTKNNTNENFDISPGENINIDLNAKTDIENVSRNLEQEAQNSPSTIRFAARENTFKKTNSVKRAKRKHNCFYCCLEVGNFSRHLERNHSDEFEVQKFMALDKNSKDRKKIIDKLRREGDFCTTNIVPVMSLARNSTDNYICCKFCRGYYASKSLRRHVKKCFFNPNPSTRCNAQIEGQTVMAGRFGPNDLLKISGLLNMMRPDEISLVAKKDAVICELARRYIKSHREKHQLAVAKRNMRRLARLIIGARKILGNKALKLIDILTPDKFKVLIKSTKIIAEYDEKERIFKSPSLALQMGTLIKHAINTAVSLAIQKKDFCKERVENLKSLLTLIETDWALEISSEAGQNLTMNKFNKPSLIPIAEDIKVSE